MQVTLTIPDELAAEYQRLLDLASEVDEREGLRQALEDVAAGRTYPAETAVGSNDVGGTQ
jgi:hypothetical protein